MKLDFTKMHGLGNDFILVDCRGRVLQDLPDLARRLCDRRFGVGADQLLLLDNSRVADFRMRVLNADGSEVEMCGNGIRCFAKYVWDRALSPEDVLLVETAAGIIKPEQAGDMVRVDMGVPLFEGRLIPVLLDGIVEDYPLTVGDREFRVSCVSMGNPHAVAVVDDLDSLDVARYGPLIERHELFPKRINAEFIQKTGQDRIRMRVWERGAGETMACGTGASAAAVVACRKGLTGTKVEVALRGGSLLIEVQDGGHVFMTGPAAEVFEGLITV